LEAETEEIELKENNECSVLKNQLKIRKIIQKI